MSLEDWVMFVPACGEGTRVAERGLKPFLKIANSTAILTVLNMAPYGLISEIAFQASMPLDKVPKIPNTVIHLFPPTRGQAHTVKLWMQRTKPRKYILISNCDNWIDYKSVNIGMEIVEQQRAGCVVFTFAPASAVDERFSYVNWKSIRNDTYEVVEKKAISADACAGVYAVRWDLLEKHIWPTDTYLSEALNRIGQISATLYPLRVEQYIGWGDMQQIEEIEKGIPQFKKD